ncbi:MAG TPA: BatD family protein [Spongiibacteraceae bacterium]|nr:BatD family protein [Spongiibacteraceae bacterium]
MNARIYKQSIALMLIWLFISLFANAANNLAPRASVDRTVVSEGDSLTLTIRIDDTGSYDAPDYSSLEKDFAVYGTSQSSQHVINNGHIESHTEWQTTLIPKHSGQLQIPPLAVAGSQTQPITIQVNPAGNTGAIDTSQPVFIEAKIDRDNVYVQQQILLTARVYVAVQLDNMQLTKPDFDNANVKQLSETTFNRNVNGVPYEVHELTYAIFPQQAGELTIPELVFSAVEVTGGNSLFDFPGRGRPLRKMSKQLSVHVKPIPKNFSGPVWLPARNLTLTESWSGDPLHLTAGDSITRSIAIRADGLAAAQLPKLDEPQLDSAKLYADQAKLDDAKDANGIHGKRVENSALIPTRAGPLQLPETRVVWWDVDSDSEKVATLPSETLHIAAGSNTASAPSPAMRSPAKPAAQPTTANAAKPEAIATAVPANKTLLGWQIATGIFALGWLVTALAYLQLRRQPRPGTSLNADATTENIDEQNTWRDFATACRNNDPAAARQKLALWATQFYRDRNVHSIEQLLHITCDEKLQRELQLLDNRLFGTLRDSSDWNGESLLQVLQDIRKRKPRKNTVAGSELSPLYPAT